MDIYDTYRSLALLPDGEDRPVYSRDALSDAHKVQLMLGLMSLNDYSELYGWGPYYNGPWPHYGVMSPATIFNDIAHDARMLPNPNAEFAATYIDDPFAVQEQVMDLLGLSDGDEDDDEDDAEDYTRLTTSRGIDTRPDIGLGYGGEGYPALLDDDITAPAVLPYDPTPVQSLRPLHPDVYNVPTSVMRGLANVLGPDVSSVSRLGGGFAGYSNDELAQRLRSLVRRV